MLNGPAEYRARWLEKPGLRAVYGDMYAHIAELMTPGLALEIGGGSGNLKLVSPSVVATDIVAAPWLDAVCDAQRLPFASDSFASVVMVDVLHHIEYPKQALREIMRVLRPGGRFVCCEPGITPVSGLFYRLFHEEPVDMGANPLSDGEINPGKDPFDSNQAIPTLLVGRYRDELARQIPGFELIRVERFSFLAYPLSGGFKSWSLLPGPMAKPLLAAEWRLRHVLGRLAAFRLLACFEKRA